MVMKNILTTYEAASGKAINLQKSEMYCSRNTPTDYKKHLANILRVRQVLGTRKYLVFPSIIGRSKKATLKFVNDRIWNRINTWSSRCLSQAGREILIKSVLQSIPLYVISIFLLPVTLLNEIKKMLNSFWWGQNSTNSRGMHWLSWEPLSVPKIFGGMGFKNLKAFNMAMIGKQAWKLISNQDSLITRLLKVRYFPHSVWRNLWSVREVVNRGLR